MAMPARMKHATPLAFVLAMLIHMPGAAQTAAPSATHVAACGLEFDLPPGYKITRPHRTPTRGSGGNSGRQCSFDIVKSKPEPPQRGECKGEEDGGQPPYDVCDWMLRAGPVGPAGPAGRSVRVVRAPPGKPLGRIDPYWRDEEGRWMLPNAQAGDQPAEPFDFYGKPAWRGEVVYRIYWYRERAKYYTGMYGGSASGPVVLVQFAPGLFVQLDDPLLDDDGHCDLLCPSLRLGARAQDLP